MSSLVIDEILLKARELFASVETSTKPATESTVGGVKLTGDLGGSAEAPTVPGLAGKAELGPDGKVLPTQLPDEFPPAHHTHTADDVTDLMPWLGVLEGAISEKAPATHTHELADMVGFSDFASTLSADVAGKAPAVHTHSKADVGLGNVDNTKDADKPVSTAQAATLAPKASPVFTGTVTAPAVKLTTGAGAGKVLTSAADGTGSWSDPASAGAPGVVVRGNPAGATPVGTAATGIGSIAVGESAKSSQGAVAIGNSADATLASSTNGIAIGNGAKSDGGVSVGAASSAAGGSDSAALGFAAKATNGVALGGNSTATYGFAIGNQATATGASSSEAVAIGRSAKATANSTVAIGKDAVAQGSTGVAVGYMATAAHVGSTAIGAVSATTADHQVMLGSSIKTVVSPNKHQIGPDGALAATLSTRANGSGKTELIVQFATGSPIVIATQP